MPSILPDPLPLFFGGTAVIEGHVFDAETGKGIEGARVFLTPAGETDGKIGTGGFQPFREVFRTEPEGGFRLEGLQAQRYTIDVEAPGYLNFLGLAQEAVNELTAARRHDEPPQHWNLDASWDTRWTEEHPAWHIVTTVYPQARAGQVVTLEIRLRRGRILRGRVCDGAGIRSWQG